MKGNNTQEPLVTVLMPVHNGGTFLRDAIESMLRQSYTNFELLIIDDASTDGSDSVIRSFEDRRIRVVSNETNLRLIATLNKGLSLAKGKYVARMDADDISLPERIEKQVAFMEANPDIGICGSSVEFIGQEQRLMKLPSDPGNIHARLLFKPPIIHPSVIINLSLLNKHSLRYSHEFLHAEDFGLWAEAAQFFKIANLPEVLLKYRLSDQNISKVALKDQSQNDEILCSIYSRQLALAKIPFNQNELHLHLLAASNYKIINTPDQFNGIVSWLSKIYKMNGSTGTYRKESLQYALALTLLSAIKRSPDVSGWTKIKGLLASFRYFSKWSVNHILSEKRG